MATTVYRIEHSEDKGGMYRGGRGLYSIITSIEDWDWDQSRHPSPDDDSTLMATAIPKSSLHDCILGDISHLHFGFASIAQLRSWLYRDEWLAGLHGAGYVLAIIESDEVYVGSTQAVFLRPEHYQTVSIKDYFNLKGENE